MNSEQGLSEEEWEIVRLFRRIDGVGQRILKGTMFAYTTSFPRKIGADVVDISEIRRAAGLRQKKESVHGLGR